MIKFRIELIGPVASGKTHLFNLVVDAARAAGWTVHVQAHARVQWTNGPMGEIWEVEAKPVPNYRIPI